jgi:hypothetical protein
MIAAASGQPASKSSVRFSRVFDEPLESCKEDTSRSLQVRVSCKVSTTHTYLQAFVDVSPSSACSSMQMVQHPNITTDGTVSISEHSQDNVIYAMKPG